MADITTRKLLQLIDSDQPADVRAAAALVLGEVGDKDAEVARTLCARLDDADAAVRAQVIAALGKLHVEKAVASLLDRVEKGGPESELAAQAVARMGSRGTKALQDLMHKVAPGLRRRIASALGAGGTSSAETAAVDALLDSDPGVVEAATRSLIAQVPSLTPAHRKALADHLLQLLGNKKSPLAPPSERAVVRLLAALDDPRVEKVLWDRVMPPHAPEMRATALQALGKWAESPSKEQMQRLLACATDADFRVGAPALLILQGLPIAKASAQWLALFQAPDVAVRRFAVEKLGDRDAADVALALLEQLHHGDAGLYDQALARLSELKAGRKALVDALLEADNPDRAWRMARAQSAWAKELPAAARTQIYNLACKYLEAGDRRSDALLFLLREDDTAALHGKLAARALALRKKKDYQTAQAYFRCLMRDPACPVPLRLEAAGCALKSSAHDLSAEARTADHAIQQLGRLIPNYEREALPFLHKSKWLSPDDLFYVGFHFAEQNGAAKKFGGQVLHLVLKKAGRAKVAKDAKSKLRSEGLD